MIRKGMRAPKLTGKPFEDEGDDVDGDGIDDWFNQVCVKFEYRLRQPFRSIKTFVSESSPARRRWPPPLPRATPERPSWPPRAAARSRACARGGGARSLRAPKPREAWRTFAKDVEASKTNLKAAPRASPKDAWASFAADERRA